MRPSPTSPTPEVPLTQPGSPAEAPGLGPGIPCWRNVSGPPPTLARCCRPPPGPWTWRPAPAPTTPHAHSPSSLCRPQRGRFLRRSAPCLPPRPPHCALNSEKKWPGRPISHRDPSNQPERLGKKSPPVSSKPQTAAKTGRSREADRDADVSTPEASPAPGASADPTNLELPSLWPSRSRGTEGKAGGLCTRRGH